MLQIHKVLTLDNQATEMEAWVGGGVEIQNVELVFPSGCEEFCFFFVFVLFF